jgi:beta-ribofuranosylaminobenzene 5'-phosphate synthase
MIVARGGADNTAPAHPAAVAVTAPSRLHLGFLDLHGGLGRRFGSLGLALDRPACRVAVSTGDGLIVEGADAARAEAHARTLCRHFGLGEKWRIKVEETIPEHVGLGSGTQMALAVGHGLCRAAGIAAPSRELAAALGRGARSSIGIAAFDQGGVILDGGRGENDGPPPVISRLPFPDAWRVLLIFDRRHQGLHGKAEVEAFRKLAPAPAGEAAALCRLMLMAGLPALAEARLEPFAQAVAELQRATGDHFAPVQGGRRYLSPAVTEVLMWLMAEGVQGCGQSSWGPTGFGLMENEADATRIAKAAERRWPKDSGLAFAISRGRNQGGEVAAA